ncbi:unnamed protein product [Rotaria sp. Silwood1]|nr:unnamed protein product [Rotaria sp. Silwood1]CAF4731407.1 unnamed protein product [Rotaria sp. Silwood1]CAF5046236.1 unnamed protein product [Rotaria sp. Silwood1]
MVRLYSKFENAREVQRQWKHRFDTNVPTVDTILSVNRKFDENGVVEDLPRSGPPLSVLSEEKLEEIEELVINNPRLSVREGAARAEIMQLNEDELDRRSEFCETWLDKFDNDSDLVDRIFWSDEAKFSMNSTVNRHNCTYWARENPHLNFEVPNNQQGITVWCGISSGGLIGPYLFNDNVNGSLYKEMLVDYLWPKIRRKGFHFQHDGAGAHYALVVREWLDEKFPNRWIGRRGPFDWPARSPDLTPCDFFLWGYLKSIVFQTPPSTIMELQERIEEACEEVTEEMCRKACRSVVHRFRDCLNNDGHFLSS